MENIDKNKFRPIPVEDKSQEFLARPVVTYWSDAWRRFKMNKTAFVAMIILSLLIIMVVIGPMISGYTMDGQSDQINQAPSAAHWFGTDELGRDLFTRVWHGGRISIIIGLVGALIDTVIGSLYGGIAAYFGGKVDTIMMRILEILISIPYLIVVIVVSILTNSRDIKTLILAMTITGWCGLARLVRGQLLALKEQDFILAAETLGVSPKNIILKHLLPNTLNVIIVAISFDVPSFIFGEAFLSFIGIGISPPNTSWGALAAAAQQRFLFYPYQLFWPALMIALTMLSFTLIGDGLRDALDPKLRK